MSQMQMRCDERNLLATENCAADPGLRLADGGAACLRGSRRLRGRLPRGRGLGGASVAQVPPGAEGGWTGCWTTLP